MLDSIKSIVYSEGYSAFFDNISPIDNPYDGVCQELFEVWNDAWWDGFYKDID